jgi:hypothetical protein
VAREAAGVHAGLITVPPGPYHYWCRMLQMPARMNLYMSMLPLATSYLNAEPAKSQPWRERIEAIGPVGAHGSFRKRVDIVCAGNPAHGLDRYRSISLQQ